MGAWSGPFAIATVLLAFGGAAKAVDPTMTAGALRRAGVRVPALLVRVGGAAEVLVAATALVTGAPIAAVLVGVSYVAFAGFVAFALRRRVPIGSCGCFGRADTPPSLLHLLVDLGAATAAFAVALRGRGGIGHVLAHQPLGGVPFLGLVAVGAYAAFLLISRLPLLGRVARGIRA